MNKALTIPNIDSINTNPIDSEVFVLNELRIEGIVVLEHEGEVWRLPVLLALT